MRPSITFITLQAAMLSVGCAGFFGNSAITTEKLDGDQLAYYTAEGGVVISAKGKMCVAPPAQAVRLINPRGTATIKAESEVEVGGTAELGHSAQKLFDTSQGNLFFQFAMYRLCEAHVNGLIAAEQYAKLFREILETARRLNTAELGPLASARAEADDAASKVGEAAKKLKLVDEALSAIDAKLQALQAKSTVKPDEVKEVADQVTSLKVSVSEAKGATDDAKAYADSAAVYVKAAVESAAAKASNER